MAEKRETTPREISVLKRRLGSALNRCSFPQRENYPMTIIYLRLKYYGYANLVFRVFLWSS